MSEVTAEMIERGRGLDPKTSASRRRRAAKVQSARERLTTSDTGHRDCDVALLRAYSAARVNMSPASFALIVSSALLSIYWVRSDILIAWTVLTCSSLILCYGLARSIERIPEQRLMVRKWSTRFIFAEFAHGVAWAGLALLLSSCSAPTAKTFMIVMPLLASGFNAMVASTIPSAVFATIMPLSLATLYGVDLPDISDPSLALIASVFAAQALFFLLAKRFHRLSYESVLFRAQKDELIAELEQAKANSDEARRRSEESNLAKSRFLATMSHELRTPLNAILGFSEVLKSEFFGAHAVPAYKEYASDIHSSGEHLLMLINEILDLSRVEAGRYELKEESVSLGQIAEDCRHLLTMRAEKRDIEVIELIEPDLPRIWADERAIRQVVLNLLTNAIKFTPQGGQVTIKVGWTSSGGQYLMVKDTGPGIPESEIAIVMSSFGRGSLAHKNAEEGTGLGLPIVKGLIELHGGEFLLRSRVRVGTEAIVVLPPQRVMNALPMMQHGDRAESASRPARRTEAERLHA
ncbi:MAG TPA: HAMP domain-containing sensor histidine kinase [Methylocystis sp.]|nr:HAMP domain-containing sensor histidine kinase [Methylocystis sp.]